MKNTAIRKLFGAAVGPAQLEAERSPGGVTIVPPNESDMLETLRLWLDGVGWGYYRSYVLDDAMPKLRRIWNDALATTWESVSHQKPIRAYNEFCEKFESRPDVQKILWDAIRNAPLNPEAHWGLAKETLFRYLYDIRKMGYKEALRTIYAEAWPLWEQLSDLGKIGRASCRERV